MNLATPRPTTNIVDALVVDGDDRDSIVRILRRGLDTQVVSLALKALQQVAAAEGKQQDGNDQAEKPVRFPEVPLDLGHVLPPVAANVLMRRTQLSQECHSQEPGTPAFRRRRLAGSDSRSFSTAPRILRQKTSNFRIFRNINSMMIRILAVNHQQRQPFDGCRSPVSRLKCGTNFRFAPLGPRAINGCLRQSSLFRRRIWRGAQAIFRVRQPAPHPPVRASSIRACLRSAPTPVHDATAGTIPSSWDR